MSSIVANQRRAYESRAKDDARRLAESLRFLSEPKRAAIIALAVAKSDTPVDITMQAEIGDEIEAHMILDDLLPRASGPYAWKLGSGCIFEIEPQEGPLE